MNKTKIDWCDYSWNPVTGCLHGCEYCYARKIANRFKHKGNLTYVNGVKPEHLSNIPYPWGFLPTFHQNRLDDPQEVKKPQNIFVCSMADLFGEWVPDEWITEVFKACKKAPQHRYLFLTKNPKRYKKLAEKGILRADDNFWYGSTTTTEKDIFFHSNKYFTFLSIEPILSKFETIGDQNRHVVCDWIIVGAETGNRKDKVIPEKQWIMDIKEQCNNAKVPIFMKESLKELMGQEFVQEFPWESDN